MSMKTAEIWAAAVRGTINRAGFERANGGDIHCALVNAFTVAMAEARASALEEAAREVEQRRPATMYGAEFATRIRALIAKREGE